MSDRTEKPAAPKRKPFKPWQKAMLGLSLLLMIVGGGLKVYAMTRPQTPQTTTPSDSGSTTTTGPRTPGSSFLSGSPSGSDSSAKETSPTQPETQFDLNNWSPAIFRLGFSFFVGFCIAYALRAFFKITAFTLGIILLAMFGLQYMGWVQIDWLLLERQYDSAVDWIRYQTASFQQFVTGQVPSAASAVTGLFVGFRGR